MYIVLADDLSYVLDYTILINNYLRTQSVNQQLHKEFKNS
jgi:hypothetical protein